jgi:hypothetical protein
MSKIDWGAYISGDMPEQDRADVRERMKQDPRVRADYDGYLDYRNAIKQAAHAEPVPHERLEAMVGALSHSRPRRLALAPAFAVAATVILLSFFGFRVATHDPMKFATTPTRERIATANPQEAARWVHAKTNMPAPRIELSGLAEFRGARYGEGWACYDYEVDGKHYFLYMRNSAPQLDEGEPLRVETCEFFVGKGIGWRTDNLAFYLRGGDEETRHRLAQAASAESRSDQVGVAPSLLAQLDALRVSGVRASRAHF